MEGVSVASGGTTSSEGRQPTTADPLATEVNLESIRVEVPPVSGSHHYLPALDGLRALAVGGVVAYHFGLHWADGGYLGVDFFFVLSGFLITGLLVGEWNRRST
ncbi:MAG TPA: acyltransferase, partial [Acidimicrobiales bacterium]|nr:acyltransferase [Acidimicrobiales bacterium]